MVHTPSQENKGFLDKKGPVQVRTGLFAHESKQGYTVNGNPIPDLQLQFGGDAPTDPELSAKRTGSKEPAKRTSLVSDADAQDRAKYHDGYTGRLAKDKRFEIVTSVIIMFNALAIGYDADYAARFERPDDLYDPDFPMQFVILENLFAVYFTFEILVRFFGYKVKWRCLCDAWFVFDSVLVTLMVMETWLLAALGGSSPLGQLSILRLLRLLRISRMAKLMRAFPELLMIIKGIQAAVSAVVWTAILLVIVTYTWAILMTSEYHQGKVTDEEAMGSVQELFGSMGKSMFSLFIMGTILDDVTFATDTIRTTDNMMMLSAFLVYILINSFTMMNMLVGILVDVVGKTAESEKKRVLEETVYVSIKAVFMTMDEDCSGNITKKEFSAMRGNKIVLKALDQLEVTERDFNRFAALLFQKDDSGNSPVITFDYMMNMLLMLRPGTPMSALDFGAFRKMYQNSEIRMGKRMGQMEEMVSAVMQTSDLGAASLTRKQTTQTQLKAELERTQQSLEPQRHTPRKALVADTLMQGGTTKPKGAKPSKRISIDMLALLERTPSAVIHTELIRRLGLVDLELTGVPLTMMDDDLRSRIKSAQI